MTLTTTVSLAPDQVSCDLDGETAILNLKTGIYYGLDPVGAAIWKLLEQPRTLESLRDAMLVRYDVDAARCQEDIFLLVEKLNREGLIQVVENA